MSQVESNFIVLIFKGTLKRCITPWFRCLMQSFKWKYRKPEVWKNIFHAFPSVQHLLKDLPTGAKKHQARAFNFQTLPNKLECHWRYERANFVCKLSYQELRHWFSNMRAIFNHLNSGKRRYHKTQERECSHAEEEHMLTHLVKLKWTF